LVAAGSRSLSRSVSFEVDDVGVAHKSVDHRGGDHVVAEDLTPAAEGLVPR
jgi:hypothetical protein